MKGIVVVGTLGGCPKAAGEEFRGPTGHSPTH
jgi:hypothetical protein